MSKNEHYSPQAEKIGIDTVLYFLGVTVGLLLVHWLIFGNKLFGPS
jgi:hypothetical protein